MITGAPARRLDDLVVVILAVATAATLGLMAGYAPVLSMAAVVTAVVVVAVAARPDAATFVVLALVYSNAVAVGIRYYGLPELTATVVPLLLLAPVVRSVVIERQPLLATRALPYAVAYLAVQLISAVGAMDTAVAIEEIRVFLLEGLVLYFLVTNAIRTERALVTALWIVFVVGSLLALLSVFQYVTGSFSSSYLGFAQTAVSDTGKIPRLTGSLGNTNRYAQVLLVLVPIGLTLAAREPTGARRALAVAGVGALLVATALTFSRGAAVGAVVVFAAAVAFRAIRPAHGAAIVVTAAVLLVFVPAYRDRLSSLTDVTGATAAEGETDADGSIRSRATENLAAGLTFLDHPVVGAGPGMFPLHYQRYAEQVGIRVKTGEREAHSMYFQVAAEGGVAGMAALGAVFAVTMRGLHAARRRWLATRPDRAALATGLLLAVAAYLVTGMFLHISYARYLWLLLALAGATATVLNSDREPAVERVA